MKTRKPLRRSRTAIARGKPPRKVNRKRKAENFARAYGSKERVAFVKTQRCAVRSVWAGHEPGIENAHIEGGGAGRKADASRVVALCSAHHALLHAWGRKTFERVYHVDLADESERLQSRWLAFRGAQDGDT